MLELPQTDRQTDSRQSVQRARQAGIAELAMYGQEAVGICDYIA